ncbi:MAG: outer membrane lipoprotein carrier protein LolA [Clostridiaceae bacterium]|nr:outer membrane lipoprotein carrier protein LolA [Clostridiaceae bacterium]
MKYWKVVVLMGIIFVLVACQQPTDEEIYYKIQKKFLSMESYQCTATIQMQHDDGEEIEYVFQQQFKNPNKYRLEALSPEGFKGNLTVYNGRTAWLYNSSINQTFKIDDFHRSPEQLMFIGYFLRNYTSTKEANLRFEKTNDDEFIVMETEIPGGNFYFDHQKLWFDKKDRTPVKLYIYDEKGNTHFRVYYKDFIYNPDLDDRLFYLPSEEEQVQENL